MMSARRLVLKIVVDIQKNVDILKIKRNRKSIMIIKLKNVKRNTKNAYRMEIVNDVINTDNQYIFGINKLQKISHIIKINSNPKLHFS
jgi:hypothetical protein